MVDGFLLTLRRSAAFILMVAAVSSSSKAAFPVPWDYKPYNVKVWIVADHPDQIDFPSLIAKLDEALYKNPGAAWSPTVERPPKIIRSVIRRNFENLQFDMLTANDYVLAMARNHEFASSVRSIATAGATLSKVLGNDTSVAALTAAGETIPKANWQTFLDSLDFDDEGRLHIAGGLQDGSEAVIYFSQLFTARLKNAIAENKAWATISDKLSIDSEGRLMLTESEGAEPREIPVDVLLEPIRKALDQEQTWAEFKSQWWLDDDETLNLKIPGTDFDLPLPDRVFKDFYLKEFSADGTKKPDGAIGLDNKEAFVNQQVLIDQIRDLLVTGDGWKAFASTLEAEPKGTLFMEQMWTEHLSEKEEGASKKSNDAYATLILPRGIAQNLQPEAKIIDPKVPGSLFSIVDSPDKIFLVKVESRTQPFRVSVRELDCAMRLMGPTTSATATGNTDLADAVARATLQAFAPTIRLENVGKKEAHGRVRAGGLFIKKAKSIGVQISNLPIVEAEEDDKEKKSSDADEKKKPAMQGVLVGEALDPDVKTSFKPGDIIVSLASMESGASSAITKPIADHPVVDLNDLLDQLDKKVTGWNVRLKVKRGGKTVTVQAPLSEGDYVRDRTSPAAINVGDFLQPVIRRIDSYGNPIMLEIVDFAFLRLDQLEGAVADMYAWAGRVGTLQGRSDRRTTRVAMKIRPLHDYTVVRMHAQRQPDVPLIGYDVYDKNLDTGKMTLAGRSDWDGRIWVEKSDAPMRLLYVKNGRSVLARLPVVPGQSMTEIADIPADDLRLRAEAYLKGIENAIVDLVAIRTLLAARIRLKLEKKDVKGARDLLEALREQPTYDILSKDMDQTSTVIKSTNKYEQASISNMFARTRKMLVEHISDRLTFDLEKDVKAVEDGKPMPSKAAQKAAEEQSASSTQTSKNSAATS